MHNWNYIAEKQPWPGEGRFPGSWTCPNITVATNSTVIAKLYPLLFLCTPKPSSSSSSSATTTTQLHTTATATVHNRTLHLMPVTVEIRPRAAAATSTKRKKKWFVKANTHTKWSVGCVQLCLARIRIFNRFLSFDFCSTTRNRHRPVFVTWHTSSS